jgi:hypothetical protein
MAASASMPLEGTLISEPTARELIGALKANTAALVGFRQDLNGPRGVGTRLNELAVTLQTIYDPEQAIVARAAVLASIDRTLDAVCGRVIDLGKQLQELAAVRAAAPAVPAESP